MAPGLSGSARYLLTSKNVGVGDAAGLSVSVCAPAAIGARTSASAASVVAAPALVRPLGMFARIWARPDQRPAGSSPGLRRPPAAPVNAARADTSCPCSAAAWSQVPTPVLRHNRPQGDRAMSQSGKTQEHARLEDARNKTAPWRKWGPYLSERQWG